MKSVFLPYGRTKLELSLPEGHPVQILEPGAYPRVNAAEDILQAALAKPIGSPGLDELTREARKILILTNDNTRPMPSSFTIPAMVSHFYHPAEYYTITILIATGLHRPMTQAEMREQFGDPVCGAYRIVNHDARDKNSLVSFGLLSTGNELYLNKLVREQDLVIAEGFIESHFFAGFSGWRKSILPGVAGESTILANHKPENIAHPGARQANLSGNPIHEECAEAAGRAGLRFILNVALDKDKRIIAAFAGDPAKAHEAGCRFVESTMSVDAKRADIVVTSNNGYPLDRNLYQVVKGVDTAAGAAAENGVIIIAARCEDQVGHADFQKLLLSCDSLDQLRETMSVSPSAIDKWQVQVLAKTLLHHKVILVSEGIDSELAERMFFSTAKTIDEAMAIAISLKGKDASICVIPEGPVIIPRVSD
ncbi:MAG: nickel-dependent lactate racemase [Clostridiales bacterium]|nr:nickel-dependent lactate racemase [Clostridiales bacterium]